MNKAALAERRLRLQQETEKAQHLATACDEHPKRKHDVPADDPIPGSGPAQAQQNHVAFRIDNERLLDLYFEYFWPSFPIVLPFHYLRARRLHKNHGMATLLSVLEWIGSIYAPWTPSEPYYMTALKAITSPDLAHTPFNVQALMLFALAEFHSDFRVEARKRLSTAVAIAVELCMNERDFARAYGEGDPVLEECWRRTYYVLYTVDQHFAIVSNMPFYTLLLVTNTVDLPCDDEYFESGVRRKST